MAAPLSEANTAEASTSTRSATHEPGSAPHRRERADGGRLPLLAPADLTDAQRRLYDTIVAPPRSTGPFLVVDDDGHLAGPFNALLSAAELGQSVQAVGAALRFSGKLSDRIRELCICLVAAELDSDYEWYAHSRVAVTVGVTTAELHELAAGTLPESLAPAETAALVLALALVRGSRVSSTVYSAALTHYGAPGVVELTVLIGYYRLLAGLLAVADVPAPDTSL